MMRFTLLVMAGIIFSFTANAEEEVFSGNYILEGWQALADINRLNANNDVKFGVCAGAITTTVDIMTIAGVMCLPQGVTNKQSAMVASKYMLEHPEELNQHYSFLIERALVGAWPCKK